MSNFIIKEEQYKNFLHKQKQWKYYNDFKEYLSLNEDETFEYLPLPTKTTKLPFKILVDDEASFIKRNHPLWLYVENKNKLIPISITHNPQIMINIKNTRISHKFIDEVKSFIRENYNALYDYGHGNIDMDTFYYMIEKRMPINESMITEMPTFNRNETGLPTDIWVDSKRDKKHGNRIKFKDTDSSITDQWATMTIDKYNPIVKNLNRKTNLTQKEIEIIKNFVRYNYDILDMAVKNPNIDFQKDFKPLMFKIGKNGGIIVPPARMEQPTMPNKTTVVDCALSKDNRMYFIADNKNNDSVKLIEELSKLEMFIKNNKYSVFVDLNKYREENYDVAYKALSNIKKIANTTGIKIKFINLRNIGL